MLKNKKTIVTFDSKKKNNKEIDQVEQAHNSRKGRVNNIIIPVHRKQGISVKDPHELLRAEGSKTQSGISTSSELAKAELSDSDSEEDFKPDRNQKLIIPKISPSVKKEELKLPSKRKVNPFASKDLAAKSEFNMPRKKKKAENDEEQQTEINRLIESLEKVKKEKEREQEEGVKICPFCSEPLTHTTAPIRKAFLLQEKKDKEYAKSQKEHFEAMNAASSFSRPAGFESTRPVPNSEKDEFCKLHRLELVIKPDGASKGYPKTIDPKKIANAMPKFETEIRDVIINKIHSDYRDIAEKAYKEQGQSKARSVMSVLGRFTATLPGYYGPKGAAIIAKLLTRMYVDSGYLEKHLVSSQLPLEFLQQVLIPEVGFRLIREDLHHKNGQKNKSSIANLNEKAKLVMKESTAYGNAMFPVDEDEVDDLQFTGVYTIDDSD